jgi:hypothetical protein
MVPAISAGRLSQRNESRVAEAGQAAVFLNADVDTEAFIVSLSFNVTKHPIHSSFQTLFLLFPRNFTP